MRFIIGIIAVFGSIVLVIALFIGIIMLFVKFFNEGITKKERKRHNDETKMIQEIYQGLSRMEKRIEALETILLDQDKKEDQA